MKKEIKLLKWLVAFVWFLAFCVFLGTIWKIINGEWLGATTHFTCFVFDVLLSIGSTIKYKEVVRLAKESEKLDAELEEMLEEFNKTFDEVKNNEKT